MKLTEVWPVSRWAGTFYSVACVPVILSFDFECRTDMTDSTASDHVITQNLEKVSADDVNSLSVL